jgi:formylglycine-generating enzyme required for sulfatase activity
MHVIKSLGTLALTSLLFVTDARAQGQYGFGCAGASGVTPTLATRGIIRAGQTWSLDITAPGGLGVGFLLIGTTGLTSSFFGGQNLPIKLATAFGDPLWLGCELWMDPNYAIVPYTFDPNVNGGLVTFDFPGWDVGSMVMQVINIDADFVNRLAGMSSALVAAGKAPPEVVAIPPGTFVMGSSAPNTAPYFNGPEQQPRHTVTISYPFWMGKYEVTIDEFVAQGTFISGIGLVYLPNFPIHEVRWVEARDYCAALTAQEAQLGNLPPGYEYRLPTEAEWEYACRAGTTTEFNVGAALDCAVANYSVDQQTGTACGVDIPTAVGSYVPNAFGLHDMHGNAAEWCLDAYQPYVAGAVTDPFVAAPAGAWNPKRVVRGGSFWQPSSECRSASRLGVPQESASYIHGFRIVLGPILVP